MSELGKKADWRLWGMDGRKLPFLGLSGKVTALDLSHRDKLGHDEEGPVCLVNFTVYAPLNTHRQAQLCGIQFETRKRGEELLITWVR